MVPCLARPQAAQRRCEVADQGEKRWEARARVVESWHAGVSDLVHSYHVTVSQAIVNAKQKLKDTFDTVR